jgi:NAD(P)-dependent dehydrogenase (short-subunit alcohol dehydrogenase family)
MAFHGKVALVTGAASGMGRISARRLAEAGARVALLDRDAEGLTETAAGAEGLRAYPCDVSDGKAVRDVVARVVDELGAIDRVTHCAAIMPTSLLAEADPEWIQKLMRVNYDGTVHVVMATLPAMLARRSGDLIVYGSIAGQVPAPHFGAYGATKAAVNLFMEVLAYENRGSGVRILLVCPPMTDTPLLEQARASSDPRSLRRGIEDRRVADPEVVVQEAEDALERGRWVVYPTREAKFVVGLRRFAPKLLWRLVDKAEAG